MGDPVSGVTGALQESLPSPASSLAQVLTLTPDQQYQHQQLRALSRELSAGRSGIHGRAMSTSISDRNTHVRAVSNHGTVQDSALHGSTKPLSRQNSETRVTSSPALGPSSTSSTPPPLPPTGSAFQSSTSSLGSSGSAQDESADKAKGKAKGGKEPKWKAKLAKLRKQKSRKDNLMALQRGKEMPSAAKTLPLLPRQSQMATGNLQRFPTLAGGRLGTSQSDADIVDHESKLAVAQALQEQVVETGGKTSLFGRLSLKLKGLTSKRRHVPSVSGVFGVERTAHAHYDADSHVHVAKGIPKELLLAMSQQFGLPTRILPKTVIPPYEAPIPDVLIRLAEELVFHDGLTQIGIFRVAADATQASATKAQLNAGTFTQCNDPHVCATLIKVWFRELPKRILSDLDPQSVRQCNEVEKVPSMLEQLSPQSRALYLWLLDLSVEVVNREPDNKMSPKAMAIVIAPNLYEAPPITPGMAPTDSLQIVDLLKKFTSFVELSIHHRVALRAKEVDALSWHAQLYRSMHESKEWQSPTRRKQMRAVVSPGSLPSSMSAPAHLVTSPVPPQASASAQSAASSSSAGSSTASGLRSPVKFQQSMAQAPQLTRRKSKAELFMGISPAPAAPGDTTPVDTRSSASTSPVVTAIPTRQAPPPPLPPRRTDTSTSVSSVAPSLPAEQHGGGGGDPPPLPTM